MKFFWSNMYGCHVEVEIHLSDPNTPHFFVSGPKRVCDEFAAHLDFWNVQLLQCPGNIELIDECMLLFFALI
jgi:hypothetical protein